jgi:glycosyltransferase involved in cell wall biosynthesis
MRDSAPHRIRVLHLINGEHYAGAERVQDLLASGLEQFGFEVGFACLKPGKFPRLRQSRQVRLYELPMRHRFDLRPVRRLVRIVRREGYQVLHAHTARSALIAAIVSLITGVPMVHHVHSPTTRDSTHRWRARFNSFVERLVLRRASALVAVSQSLAPHILRQGLREELVCVVHNGVPSCQLGRPSNSTSTCPSNGTPQHVRESGWTLGTVALFRPRKGVDVLLSSLALLKSQGLPVRLRAVGSFETPEYERQVKKLSAELGLHDLVDWTGFSHDVESELARMDLFVLPSLFGEGLPMVVLEAMAAGVPVVATRVEGTPEAIRDGQDGLIAEPDDPQDLAAAIRCIISGEVDWHALRRSALRRHADKFSQQSMAAGVAGVYRRVLAEWTRGRKHSTARPNCLP